MFIQRGRIVDLHAQNDFSRAVCYLYRHNLQITNQHWIGGRCRKNSTGHHYYWDTAEGEVAFDFSSVPSGVRTSAMTTCDTAHDGIVFSGNEYDDVNSWYKRPFICEMPWLLYSIIWKKVEETKSLRSFWVLQSLLDFPFSHEAFEQVGKFWGLNGATHEINS